MWLSRHHAACRQPTASLLFVTYSEPSSSFQVKVNSPLSTVLKKKDWYGLVEIDGYHSASNTGLSLNAAMKRLMILRGTAWPETSLRWPDSISCAISVLISMISPALAWEGIRTFGIGFDIRKTPSSTPSSVQCGVRGGSAAATADGDLDGRGRLVEIAVGHFGDADDVLRLRQAHACRRCGLAAGRRKLVAEHVGQRIAFREDMD